MFNGRKVSAVIPALNEAQSIALVVSELLSLWDERGPLIDEVIVCNNGSTDQTEHFATMAGARVVSEPQAGYGRACQRAIAALYKPDIVLFVDADYSVYTEQVKELLQALGQGSDLVIGSRTLGTAEPGSLTFPQRVGNKLATLLIRFFWGQRVTDLGPFRAITATSLDRLGMCDERFGWTIEMQIKAIQKGLAIAEVPVDTRCRIGKSKISGTVKGVIGAGIGIIGMVFRLRYQASDGQRVRAPSARMSGFKA